MSSSQALSAEDWKGVLILGHFWQVDSAFKEASEAISRSSSVRPAERLYLAKRFQICEWIGKAFKELLQTPVKDLTADDLHWLTKLMPGTNPMQSLAVALQALYGVRSAFIVFNAPKALHTDLCLGLTQTSCIKHWAAFWKEHMVYFHQANFAFDGRAVLREMEGSMNRLVASSPHYECVAKNVDALKVTAVLWKKEDSIIEEARLAIVGV